MHFGGPCERETTSASVTSLPRGVINKRVLVLSFFTTVCLQFGETIDAQVVVHTLSRSISEKTQTSSHLITMDSPIVKATIQSTLLGALSNIIGQLIGCWQSGVSPVYVHSP